MIDFCVAGLAHNWQWLKGEKNAAYEKSSESATSQPSKMDLNRLNGLLVNGAGVFKGLLYFCEVLEMDKSAGRINHLKMQLSISNYTPSFAIIHNELMALENAIWGELIERKFTFIPTGKVVFFEQSKLFDLKVYNAFPSAVPHLTDAGNCLAFDLNTAAVFHLMIIAEYGLRALTKHLKLKTKSPLEFSDWEAIITVIDTKLNVIKTKPRGIKKQRNLEFYRSLLTECSEFKDVWRNNIMHARRRYYEPEALEVFQRVKKFMQRLANAGISETP